MRIASVLTPLSDDNLRLAAQCGVEDIILRYPGGELADLLAARDRIESFGMRIGAIEGYLPIEHIKVCDSIGDTSARDSELAAMKQLLRHMGVAEIPVCCYNFMPGTDWVRTAADVRERGDAWVTAFRLTDAQHAARLDYQATALPREPITAEALWRNLEWFLQELRPDHVPQLLGEEEGPPGYTMLGRLFAFGYMRGLIQAVTHSPTSRVSDLLAQ